MDYALGAEAALEELGVKLAEVIARVYSQSQKGKRYTVRKDDGQYSCSCPDFKYRHAGRGTHCKHIKTRIERQAADEKTAAIVYAVSPDNRTHVATRGGQVNTSLYSDLGDARHQAMDLSEAIQAGAHLQFSHDPDPLFHQPMSGREKRRLDQAAVAHYMRPTRTSPRTSILALDVPDDLLKERRSVTTTDGGREVSFYRPPEGGWSLAPGQASRVETGLGNRGFLGVAEFKTPEEVRLRRALVRRGVDPDKVTPLRFSHKILDEPAEHLIDARALRKDRLRKLRQALKDAPPPPPPPSRKTPPAAAPKTPTVPPGFNWKHPAVLGAGALGLAGLGYGAYRMFDRKRKERQAADDAASAA